MKKFIKKTMYTTLSISSISMLSAMYFDEVVKAEEVTQEGATQEEATQEGVTQEEATQEEVTQEGATQEGATQEGATQEGVTQEGVTQEGVTQEGVIQEEATQEGVTQEEVTQEEATQEGVTQEEATQEGVTQQNNILPSIQELELYDLVTKRQIYPQTTDIILNEDTKDIYGLQENFNYSFYINGELIELKNGVVLHESRIFMPLRELGDLVGAEVSWINDYRIAILEAKNDFGEVRRIEIPIGTSKANIIDIYEYFIDNNNQYFIDNIYYLDETNPEAVSFIINGSSYIPVRFIAENLGFTVTYFDDYKEIHFTSINSVAQDNFDYELPTQSVGYTNYLEQELQKAEEQRLEDEKKALLEEKAYLDALEEQKNYSFTSDELASLNKMISGYGSGVSVFFKDLNSGYTYMNNEYKKYFIASVVKAPYCMYVYDLASQGKANLSTRYTYYSKHYASGTGVLKNKSVGTSYTLQELLSYAIINSDNVAMNILKDVFGTTGYKEYATNLGLNYPADIGTITGGNITAIDCGVYIEAIYNFINNNIYGNLLRRDMLLTSNKMIVANAPVVRKYGWAGSSFHDMALVEATNPYLLCILTNSDGNFNIFTNISKAVETYSQKEDRSLKIEMPESMIDRLE